MPRSSTAHTQPIHATTPAMTTGFLVWGFGALFYLLGFFHRVAPAVITGELMRDFQISAASLGNLSAFYFYSYVAMQIPTGILADRWGPRRLLTMGAMVASVGALVFALAPGLNWAAAGRLLIGGSVAVAFVGLLKIAANWFAPNRFALVSGMALFAGIVGAVFAGTPLRILVDRFGWRNAVLFSAVAAIAVAAGTWLFVRDYPHEKGFKDFIPAPSKKQTGGQAGIVRGIIDVFAYRNTVLLFIIPGGIVGSVLTFSGLWGVPYLKARYAMSSTGAATLASSLLVAWAVGGPFFGWLSDRLGNRKTIYIVGCAIAVAGWTLIIIGPALGLATLIAVLLITGFSSGCMIISFAYGKESVSAHLAGTVSGVINMGVMIGPMVLQPAVGWILDQQWRGVMDAGVRVYDAAAYQRGFLLMLTWMLISFVLLFLTRETRCRQTE